jgi:hypothetical protein
MPESKDPGKSNREASRVGDTKPPCSTYRALLAKPFFIKNLARFIAPVGLCLDSDLAGRGRYTDG